MISDPVSKEALTHFQRPKGDSYTPTLLIHRRSSPAVTAVITKCNNNTSAAETLGLPEIHLQSTCSRECRSRDALMCADGVLQCSVPNREPARFNEAASSGTSAQGVQSQAITSRPQPLLLLAPVNSNLC